MGTGVLPGQGETLAEQIARAMADRAGAQGSGETLAQQIVKAKALRVLPVTNADPFQPSAPVAALPNAQDAIRGTAPVPPQAPRLSMPVPSPTPSTGGASGEWSTPSATMTGRLRSIKQEWFDEPGARRVAREEAIAARPPDATARLSAIASDPKRSTLTRGAAALGSMATGVVQHPIETAGQILLAPFNSGDVLSRYAYQQAAKNLGIEDHWYLAGGKPVTGEEAAWAAAQLATLGVASRITAVAESALLAMRVPAAVGSTVAGALAHAPAGALVGAAYSPGAPGVGAVAGALAGGAHGAVKGLKVPGAGLADVPERLLPEAATKEPQQAISRANIPPAPAEPDYVVEPDDTPSRVLVPPSPKVEAPAAAEPPKMAMVPQPDGTVAPVERPPASESRPAAPVVPPAATTPAAPTPSGPEAPATAQTPSLADQIAVARAENARLKGKASPDGTPPAFDDTGLHPSARTGGTDKTAPTLRDFAKVTTDGIYNELAKLWARRDDATARSQYRFTPDENFHSTEDGRSVMNATRSGQNGVTDQAKAQKNVRDMQAVEDRGLAELKRRGIEEGAAVEEIATRQKALGKKPAAEADDDLVDFGNGPQPTASSGGGGGIDAHTERRAIQGEQFAEESNNPDHFVRDASGKVLFEKKEGYEAPRLRRPDGYAGLYSRLGRAIQSAPFQKGTAEQWAAHLSKDVAKGEKEWTGTDRFLAENTGKVLTKEQVQQHFEANKIGLAESVAAAAGDAHRVSTVNAAEQAGGPGDIARVNPRPEFAQYTEPGGKNYREIKIQLDRRRKTLAEPATAVPDDVYGYHVRDANGRTFGHYAGESADAALEKARRSEPTLSADPHYLDQRPAFLSSHFPSSPDILAHARVNERTLPNGEKVLFVEELQSDWHQQGKKGGYMDRASKFMARDDGGIVGYYRTEAEAEDAVAGHHGARVEPHEGGRTAGQVPDAPFKKTEEWLGLAMKRLIEEAVSIGADRIAWTTGEQQSARYDLSKQVDRVSYRQATGQLIASKDSETSHKGNYDPKALPEVIGKEAAAKLLASAPSSSGLQYIEGGDLKVGAAGMRAFYDNILPGWVRDYAKKMGVRLDIESVPATGTRGNEIALPRDVREGGRLAADDTRIVLGMVANEMESEDIPWRDALKNLEPEIGRRAYDDAREILKATTYGSPVNNQSFKITPELAAKVKAEGQPLMERKGQVYDAAQSDLWRKAKANPTGPEAKQFDTEESDLAFEGKPIPASVRAAMRALQQAGHSTVGERARLVAPAADRAIVSIEGTDVSTPTALRAALTVARSPFVEHLQLLLVDPQTDRVVIHRTGSSGALNHVVFGSAITDAIQEAKANGLELILAHNHPSGKAASSPEDRMVTLDAFAEGRNAGVTVRGHMVIDHDKASWLREGSGGGWVEESSVTAKGADAPAENWMSGGPLIVSPQSTMAVVAAFHDPAHVSVLFTDGEGKLVAAHAVPVDAITSMHEWLPAQMKAVGALNVALAAGSGTPIKSIVSAIESHYGEPWAGSVVDVLGVEKDGGYFSMLERGTLPHGAGREEVPKNTAARFDRPVQAAPATNSGTGGGVLERPRLRRADRSAATVSGEPSRLRPAQGQSVAESKGDTPQTETPAFRTWFGDSKVVDEQGMPLVVYHGAQRSDRFGPRLIKSRATSGPMPFFTDDPEIGSKYATGKVDTSLPDEDANYEAWYRLKVPGFRNALNLDRAWHSLTPEERAKIKALAPRVKMDDETGHHVELGDESETRGNGGYDLNDREVRGNALKGLTEAWLNSGALFDDEEAFYDVLRLAGVPMDRVEFHHPHAAFPGVTPAYLSIRAPLVTHSVPSTVVDALAKASGRQRLAGTRNLSDPWAKETRNPREWMSQLREDMASGTNSTAWTSIPDWVTKTLSGLGYDGIHDTGGKMGGQEHSVWIPFEPGQAKSAIANRGTFDPKSANILKESKDSPYSTGIKNSESAKTRERFGMGERETPETRSFEEMYEAGKQALVEDPAAETRLLSDLASDPERIVGTETEAGILLKSRVDLDRDFRSLLERRDEAIKAGNEAAAKLANIQLQLQREKIRNFLELYERTGTASGRALAARRMMSRLDYSLSGMESGWSAAKGSALDESELDAVRKLADEWKAASDAKDKDVAEAERRRAEAEADLHHALLRLEARGPLPERFAKATSKAADDAAARLRAKGLRAMSGLDPQDLADIAVIGVDELTRGAQTFADWSASMVHRLGDYVTPHLHEVFTRANTDFNEAISKEEKAAAKATLRPAKPKAAPKVPQAPPTTRAKMQKRLEDGADLGDLQPYLRRLALEHINEGTTARDAVLDALHSDVSAAGLDVTRDDVRDALSGYGKFSPLNKAADLQRLREIQAESQKLAQLDALRRGESPLATGFERGAPSDETRALTKQVNEAKKAAGIGGMSEEGRLKSALDSAKTRVRNQIADLQTEIDTGERIVSGKHVLIADSELDALKAHLAELRKAEAEVFGKAEMSDEKRLALATKAAERNAKAWADRLDGARNSQFASPGQRARVIVGPEIDALRAKAKLAKQEYQELKKMDPAQNQLRSGAQNEAYRTRLAQKEAELLARIARNDYRPNLPRPKMVIDRESLARQAAVKKVEGEYHAGVRKFEKANRTILEKVTDRAAAWSRIGVLSFPSVVGKLFSVAVSNSFTIPLTDAAAAGVALTMPRLAAGAPRYGGSAGVALKAELAAQHAFWTAGLKEAGRAFLNKQSHLDLKHSKYGAMPSEWWEYMGQIHRGLHEPVKEAEYARSMYRRRAEAAARGEDTTDPIVELRLSNAAYQDALAATLMNQAPLTAKYNRWVRSLGEVNKDTGKPIPSHVVLRGLVRVQQPIVKVPINAAAMTSEFMGLGLPSAFTDAWRFYHGVDDLKPIEKDAVIRKLARGLIGSAVMLMAFYKYKDLGGFYQRRGAKRAPNDVPADAIRIGETTIPPIYLHNPLIWAGQAMATTRRVAESRLAKKDADPQGYGAGVMAAALGVADEMPFAGSAQDVADLMSADTRGEWLAKRTAEYVEPGAIRWLATPHGFIEFPGSDSLHRKPKGLVQHLEYGVPGLRKNVPLAPATGPHITIDKKGNLHYPPGWQ